MRIALATDCWFPQINGITRCLEATVRELRAMGHDVLLLTPADFFSVQLPYRDRLVMPWYPRLARHLAEFDPETVHMATQGPLALCARAWCWRHRRHYTTAFHTRFPEYAKLRYRLPDGLLYSYARLFHGRTAPVLVTSHTLAEHLRQRGIGVPRVWALGVDTALFRAAPKTWTQYPRPIHLYVGRVVAEKNFQAFLNLRTGGSKIVAGDGPPAVLAAARATSPETVFLGELQGDALAHCYREADVFVFPSRLDTFGLVVLEALASGVPVAAYPSPHLVEVFGAHGVVAFDPDLAAAAGRALAIAPQRCSSVAAMFSWRASAEQFMQIIRDDRHERGFA